MKGFTCKNCGESELEEVMIHVTVSSVITGYDGADLHYGYQNNDGGVVDRYQCVTCGTPVTFDDGVVVTRLVDLVDVLNLTPDEE